MSFQTRRQPAHLVFEKFAIAELLYPTIPRMSIR